MKCKCYTDTKNYIGKRGICEGTKEREPCSCEGNESRCDFYEYKRAGATSTPVVTHYDMIMKMSIEDLADYLVVRSIADLNTALKAYNVNAPLYSKQPEHVAQMLKWLKQEVQK